MQIINHDERNNVALAAAVEAPQFVMDNILVYFSDRSWITLTSRTVGGHMHVLSVSPSLRREFAR
jgi:hypothetical protein